MQTDDFEEYEEFYDFTAKYKGKYFFILNINYLEYMQDNTSEKDYEI